MVGELMAYHISNNLLGKRQVKEICTPGSVGWGYHVDNPSTGSI